MITKRSDASGWIRDGSITAHACQPMARSAWAKVNTYHDVKIEESEMIKSIAISFALAAASISTAYATTDEPSNPQLTEVNIITFQGGWNLPIWVAQEKGFFKKNGLDIKLEYTANSAQLVKELLSGKHDIAVAGIDNVIAYQEGQGATPVENPDMFAFYGVDNGLLSLVANPKIQRVGDLRGHKVSVDALTTGYAFVVRNYLEQNNLTDKDVQYSSVGSTNDRFNALVAGTTDATLLRTPLNLQAKAKGFKILASGNQLGDYQGTTGVTTRSWAADNGDVLVSYLRSYLDGLSWIYDQKNQKEAEAILASKAPGMTGDLAGPALQELLHNGLQRDAAINAHGVKNVLELRSKLGSPPKKLTDETKYFDTTYYEKAVKLNSTATK